MIKIKEAEIISQIPQQAAIRFPLKPPIKIPKPPIPWPPWKYFGPSRLHLKLYNAGLLPSMAAVEITVHDVSGKIIRMTKTTDMLAPGQEVDLSEEFPYTISKAEVKVTTLLPFPLITDEKTVTYGY